MKRTWEYILGVIFILFFLFTMLSAIWMVFNEFLG